MPIVQTVNKYSFINAFKLSDRKDQFSYEALEAIFEELDSVASDDNIEFDMIAVCCEWVEETWQDIADSYSIDIDDDATEEEAIETVQTFLQDHTVALPLSGGSFVYVAF